MVSTGKVCKLLMPCSPRTLKQWLQCRLDHHPTLDRADLAERAHIAPGRIKAWAADSEPAQINVPALLRLCHVLGDFSAFDLVLGPYGYRVARLEPGATKTIEREALDATAAMGTVVAAVNVAIEDGRPDVHECAAIRQFLAETRKQLDELDAALPRERNFADLAEVLAAKGRTG